MDSYDKKSYGKDNSYYESKDSSNAIVKKNKCNNIIVNLNGFNGVEVGTLPTALSGLATDEAQTADEGEIGASSSGNGDGSDGKSSGHDSNSRYVCINNNNNNVGGETPVPPVPPEDACLLCFEEISDALRDAIIAALVAPGELVIVEGELEVPATVITIEGLCEWLGDNAPLELTETQIDDLIDTFADANPTIPRAEIEALVDCFIDARIIEEEPLTCDDCFARLDPPTQLALNAFLTLQGDISLADMGIQYTIDEDVNNIAELCIALNTDNIEITDAQISVLATVFVNLGVTPTDLAIILVECLIEAGVVDVE